MEEDDEGDTGEDEEETCDVEDELKTTTTTTPTTTTTNVRWQTSALNRTHESRSRLLPARRGGTYKGATAHVSLELGHVLLVLLQHARVGAQVVGRDDALQHQAT